MLRALLLLASLLALTGCGASLDDAGSAVGGGRTADRVERVVDGDTVVLAVLGKARLIGVDTPEVYGGVECYGREASAYAKKVLREGRRVRYRLGVDPRDRYDRALVHLWLDDDRFFNAMLVRNGYAMPLTVPPNIDYADRFVALAREAREAERGLWAQDACPSG